MLSVRERLHVRLHAPTRVPVHAPCVRSNRSGVGTTATSGPVRVSAIESLKRQIGRGHPFMLRSRLVRHAALDENAPRTRTKNNRVRSVESRRLESGRGGRIGTSLEGELKQSMWDVLITRCDRAAHQNSDLIRPLAGVLDSNQEQLKIAIRSGISVWIGEVPRDDGDLMRSSVARTTDRYPPNLAVWRPPGGFLVTNVVTRSRRPAPGAALGGRRPAPHLHTEAALPGVRASVSSHSVLV